MLESLGSRLSCIFDICNNQNLLQIIKISHRNQIARLGQVVRVNGHIRSISNQDARKELGADVGGDDLIAVPENRIL